MENKEDTQQPVLTKKKWYASYVVAGLIIGGGTAFAKTLVGGELVLLGAGIGAIFLYYPLKSKIKIKNEVVRVIITFFILLICAGMLVGFVGGLINGLISKSDNQQGIAECKTICDFAPVTKVWEIPFHNSNGKFVSTKFFQTQEQCIDYCLTQ